MLTSSCATFWQMLDAVAKMEHKKIIMKIINKAAAEGYAIPFRQRR
jgi:hypothetical protein